MEKYFGVWRKDVPTDGLIFFVAGEDWLSGKEQRSVINAKKYLLSEAEANLPLDFLISKCPPPTQEEIDRCYGMTKNLANQSAKPKQEETKTE